MLKAEQVPETVAHAAEAAWSKDATWQQIITAALNAWPVIEKGKHYSGQGRPGVRAIILPLPTEPET